MNAKVLNVDDHDAARYARSRFLNRAGFQVLEAATGGDEVVNTQGSVSLLNLLMRFGTGK